MITLAKNMKDETMNKHYLFYPINGLWCLLPMDESLLMSHLRGVKSCALQIFSRISLSISFKIFYTSSRKFNFFMLLFPFIKRAVLLHDLSLVLTSSHFKFLFWV